MKFKQWSIAFLLLASGRVAAAQEDCNLRRDEDGIKVYTCHQDTARFKSVRAEIFLENTSLEAIKAIILDVENYVNWQHNLLEAQVLEKVSDSEEILHTVVDVPWPVSNRELITRLKVLEADTAKLKIKGESISYDYPAQRGLVRVPFSQTIWDIEVINGTDLMVHYFLMVDPGGSVPAWLVNLTIAQRPYDSFKNLRRLANEGGANYH
jgi:START domain